MFSPGTEPYSIDNFNGGLNVTKQETDILDHQSPSAVNITFDEINGINSRYGTVAYYSTSLITAVGITTAVNGLFTHNKYGTSTFMIHYGSGLYKDLISTVTGVYSGLAATVSRSFQHEGFLHVLDGSSIIKYSGTGVASTVSGYVPLYKNGNSPDGVGGILYQELNWFTSGFREEFNGDGAATAYYMTFGTLTPDNLLVYANGTQYSSGLVSLGYSSVDWTSGIIHFVTAPTTGTNNVEIQAYKEILTYTAITNCTIGVVACGNALAFYAGNPSYPNRIFYSDDIYGPSYVAATSIIDIGTQDDKITGLLPAYDGAVLVAKQRSIHLIQGLSPDFSRDEIVAGEGCIATDSLQSVNGAPIMMSQRGICQIKRELNNQFSLDLISEDINGVRNIRSGLITEDLSYREQVKSIVFDNKYWVSLNSKLYMMHYNLIHQKDSRTVYPWIKWEEFDIRNLIIKDGYLYYGTENNILKFDPTAITDYLPSGQFFNQAIVSYWYSKKYMVQNLFDWVKWFIHVWFDFRARTGLQKFIDTSVNMRIFVDDSEISSDKSFETAWFDPDAFNPDAFVFEPSQNINSFRVPIGKKGRFIQVGVKSTEKSKAFSLGSIKVLFKKDRKVI